MEVGLCLGFILGGGVVMLVGLLLLFASKNAMDDKDSDFISIIIGVGMYVSSWVVIGLAFLLGVTGLIVYLWGKFFALSMVL